MKISHITPQSFVDGPGCRTVVFFQGCPLACHGCQNRSLWPADGGRSTTPAEVAADVMSLGNKNITISGGEPTEQMGDLLSLVRGLRDAGAEHIIVYTGRTFDWLSQNKLAESVELVQLIDVLVDGPFIKEQDDPFINWRGSRNQRPIDCKASIKAGRMVELDWSAPEIQIGDDGSLHLPVGLAGDFAEIGDVKKSRMCGQTKPV